MSNPKDKTNDSKPSGAEKDAEIIREMIGREDDVLNTRLTWCATIEGLLMTALAFAWKDAPPSFTYVLAAAGITVAASTFYATTTAVKTMRELEAWFIKKWRNAYAGPPVIGFSPKRWSIHILRPSIALPLTFAVMWILILGVRYYTPLPQTPNPPAQPTNSVSATIAISGTTNTGGIVGTNSGGKAP